MGFFNRRGWALFLAAAVLGAACVSNGDRTAALVGHWVHYEGATRGKPEVMELFKDGTGVVDKGSVTWKVENKRFVLLSALGGMTCDYKVSGYELILAYDDEDSATFVKKEKLEEYRKKRAEAELREAERAKKEAEQMQKDAEQRLAKISSYFTDTRNGQKYRTVKIGGKSWMAENLNYQTGTSWCYENDESKCKQYGRLYDWNTAKTACPRGWHLPSQEEWNTMVAAAGGDVAGKKLKSTYGWDENGNGTDEFGFSALPGGYRNPEGAFCNAGNIYWWTATELGGGLAYNRGMDYGNDHVYEGIYGENDGFSVRCRED